MTTKERPIRCNATEVRAILEGRKTQTRRIVKFTEFGVSDTPGYQWHFRGTRKGGKGGLWQDMRHEQILDLCQYGKPGDRLWVQEPFSVDVRDPVNCVIYGATPEYGRYRDTGEIVRASFPDGTLPTREEAKRGMLPKFWKQKSPFFMPRWASRITLEITGVRVERLQDISEADAKAEGVDAKKWNSMRRLGPRTESVNCFASLWESINGPESWAANPWVWVVEFRRANP